MITNLAEHTKEWDLPTQRVLKHFNDILEIPRPSSELVENGEEGIREHLRQFAAAHSLECREDEVKNIAIDIPASKDCEDKLRIVLQAHMDMVTMGGNDKRATQARIEDGWLKSDGKTTLGADNGIAIAMCMALAEDKELRHGPLTFLFTVSEEKGMIGAKKLDPKLIPEDAAILVNLDAEDGAHLICNGSAGSVDVTGNFNVSEKVAIPEGYEILEIDLGGLPGGHSGDEIHQRRGNSIRLLNNLLESISNRVGADFKLVEYMDFKLIEYTGGEQRNSLPVAARCVIAVPKSEVEAVKQIAEHFRNALKKGVTPDADLSVEHARDLKINVENVDVMDDPISAIADDVKDSVMKAIREVCDLEIEAEGGFKGGVLTSSSLGVIDLKEDVLRLQILARAAKSESLGKRAGELTAVLSNAGASVLTDNRSEGWLEMKGSRAVDLAVQAVKQVVPGKIPQVFAYHAGLESALIKERVGALSAVAIGPKMADVHSRNERVSLESIADINKVVRRMVELVCSELSHVITPSPKVLKCDDEPDIGLKIHKLYSELTGPVNGALKYGVLRFLQEWGFSITKTRFKQFMEEVLDETGKVYALASEGSLEEAMHSPSWQLPHSRGVPYSVLQTVVECNDGGAEKALNGLKELRITCDNFYRACTGEELA